MLAVWPAAAEEFKSTADIQVMPADRGGGLVPGTSDFPDAMKVEMEVMQQSVKRKPNKPPKDGVTVQVVSFRFLQMMQKVQSAPVPPKKKPEEEIDPNQKPDGKPPIRVQDPTPKPTELEKQIKNTVEEVNRALALIKDPPPQIVPLNPDQLRDKRLTELNDLLDALKSDHLNLHGDGKDPDDVFNLLNAHPEELEYWYAMKKLYIDALKLGKEIVASGDVDPVQLKRFLDLVVAIGTFYENLEKELDYRYRDGKPGDLFSLSADSLDVEAVENVVFQLVLFRLPADPKPVPEPIVEEALQVPAVPPAKLAPVPPVTNPSLVADSD